MMIDHHVHRLSSIQDEEQAECRHQKQKSLDRSMAMAMASSSISISTTSQAHHRDCRNPRKALFTNPSPMDQDLAMAMATSPPVLLHSTSSSSTSSASASASSASSSTSEEDEIRHSLCRTLPTYDSLTVNRSDGVSSSSSSFSKEFLLTDLQKRSDLQLRSASMREPCAGALLCRSSATADRALESTNLEAVKRVLRSAYLLRPSPLIGPNESDSAAISSTIARYNSAWETPVRKSPAEKRWEEAEEMEMAMEMEMMKKKKKMQDEDQMARSTNEQRRLQRRQRRLQAPAGLLHQRSQSMRLDSHISPGHGSFAQMKQKDWRWEAGYGGARTAAGAVKEYQEENALGSKQKQQQQQQQKRGAIMAMDARNGGDGRVSAGIKNGYPSAAAAAAAQRQGASVLRSMSMRAGASSASDPAMAYVVLGCAICGEAAEAAPLVRPPLSVVEASAMAAPAPPPPPPPPPGCGGHCTCRCGDHEDRSRHGVLPAEEAMAMAMAASSSSSSSSSSKAAKSGVKKKNSPRGGGGGGGRLLGACRRMLGQLAFRSKRHS